MKLNLITKTTLLISSSLLMATVSSGYEVMLSGRYNLNVSRARLATQNGVSFQLVRSPENPRQLNLILSDGDEGVASGSYVIEQLRVFQTLMVEARKFAQTEEAAGKDKPITTRFTSIKEPGFIIDVMKSGNQSQMFITLTTGSGHLTVEAGAINRSTKREAGVFFELLSRIEFEITKSTGKPSK